MSRRGRSRDPEDMRQQEEMMVRRHVQFVWRGGEETHIHTVCVWQDENVVDYTRHMMSAASRAHEAGIRNVLLRRKPLLFPAFADVPSISQRLISRDPVVPSQKVLGLF